MRSEIIEELHVGAYPKPSQPIEAASSGARAPALSTTDQQFIIAQKAELVSNEPDDDPHHPDLIISYDVINEEVRSPACVLEEYRVRALT